MKKIACEPQVGADIEVFMANPANAVIVPCVEVFKGTKAEPYHPPSWDEGYFVQEDNVMCEFNVPPIAGARNGQKVMDKAKTYINKLAGTKKLQPVWNKVSHRFVLDDLKSKQAQTFGCEADYDAYAVGARRVFPKADEASPWRSCGGHVHIGGDFKCPDFVAALFAEYYMGIMFNGLWTSPGKKVRRKEWYGLPGIFRPKPYGIEYRTPDNYWLRDSDNIYYMYDAANRCANHLTKTSALDLQRQFRAIPWTVQREYMMTGDQEALRVVNNAAQKAGIAA